CDLYFVERFRGLEEAGAYNAVFRLVEAVRLAPAAVLAVMFPALCRAADAAPLSRLAARLGAAGVAVGAATAWAAPVIVRLAYGDAYASAAPVLVMLSLAVPLLFVNYALTHQLIGWNGQRAYLQIVLAALAANLALNLALVPPYGMRGAALGTIATELVVTAGCLVALARRPGVAPLPRQASMEGA
ncbi:MAG: polysaccharide biosynthesis C-terminal domain-containing protein, partial [Acidobacteriota bacterium]